MTSRVSAFVTSTLLLGAPGIAGAQQLPPIRSLGIVLATSDTLSGATAVRAISGGRVLVNDMLHRRVVLLDSTLRHGTIVADSTPSTQNAYGARFGGLLAYRGDSSLFIDPASMSMLVIDPAGKIVRVISVPRTEDAMAMAMPTSPAVMDPNGRLVYRQIPRPRFEPMTAGGAIRPIMPDSAPIVRADPATRKVDTLAWTKVPAPNITISRNENGGVTALTEINPMPVLDDWTVLADGSVAVIRGRDYHVDFVRPDGSRTSAAKVPYEWQRMTDEDKVAFIDSARTAMENMRKAIARRDSAGASGAAAGALAGAAGAEAGRVMVFMGGPGGRPGDLPPINFVQPSTLPDYRPAISASSSHADPDGNLWVRTTLFRPGAGPVYDVIDKNGKLVDRVQFRIGTQLLGFGPDGDAYVADRQNAVVKLQRVRVR